MYVPLNMIVLQGKIKMSIRNKLHKTNRLVNVVLAGAFPTLGGWKLMELAGNVMQDAEPYRDYGLYTCIGVIALTETINAMNLSYKRYTERHIREE